jgi:hypothetical protein
MQKYILLGIKILISLAFVAAGAAKLIGAEMMVQTFEFLGTQLGFENGGLQWFRYVTGLIEVGSVALLWLNGRQAIGAGLLVCTMIGATLAHLFILGPSALPAVILGLLSAYVLYSYRGQLVK